MPKDRGRKHFSRKPRAGKRFGVGRVPSRNAPQLPAVDLASYMAPYAFQEQSARGNYEAAVPVINQTYDQSAQRQAAIAAEVEAQIQAIQAQIDQTLASQQQSLSTAGQVAGADMAQFGGSLAPSLAQAVQTALAEEQANAQLASTNQTALSQRLRAAQASSMGERRLDAEGMRAAALSGAGTNLQSALSEIGLGQANAMRQYEQDSTDNALTMFQLEQEQSDRAREEREREDEEKASLRAAEREALVTAFSQAQQEIEAGATPTQVRNRIREMEQFFESGDLYGAPVDTKRLLAMLGNPKDKGFLGELFDEGSDLFGVDPRKRPTSKKPRGGGRYDSGGTAKLQRGRPPAKRSRSSKKPT